MRTTVIFDIGGVLIDWDPRHLYRKLFDDEDAMEHFLATVCTPEWNAQQDEGRTVAEGTALLTERFPEHAALILAYYDRFGEMMNGPLEETVSLLGELRGAGTPLYALSNWSRETFPLARERFEFLDWFRGIVISGEEGVKKPDPRIYQLLLHRYRIDPGAA
ncbi:MAG: HAD family hydrolase, partial [Alphaproteobacteria bacterium]